MITHVLKKISKKSNWCAGIDKTTSRTIISLLTAANSYKKDFRGAVTNTDNDFLLFLTSLFVNV